MEHNLLTARKVKVLLTLLLLLIILSALALYNTIPSLDLIVSSYPFGFLQTLPPIFWVTLILYTFLGFFILTSKTISSANRNYFLLVILAFTALKVAAPLLITGIPLTSDGYSNYISTQAVIYHGHVLPQYSYYAWPGELILTATLQSVSGISSIFILTFMPLLLQVMVILFAYLIAVRLFGQKSALLGVFILANLGLPVGLHPHLVPYLVATLLVMIMVYCISGRISNRNSGAWAFSVLGIITLMTLVITHLLSPFLAIVFILGFYLMTKIWAPLMRQLNTRNWAKYAFLLVIIIIGLAALVIQRGYFAPALSAAFLTGIYISSNKFGHQFINYVMQHRITRYLSLIFIASGVLIFPWHNFISSLFISLMVGLYLREHFIGMAGNASRNESDEFWGGGAERAAQLTTFVILAFVTSIFWWMSREPETFRTVATVMEAAITQYKIEAIYPVGSEVKALFPELFSLPDLWHLTLISVITVVVLAGIYLSWRQMRYKSTNYLIWGGGFLLLIVAKYILNIFRAYDFRLESWLILFGIAALSAVVIMMHSLKLRKLSLAVMIVMCLFMLTSPLAAYDAHGQGNYLFVEDKAASQFIVSQILSSQDRAVFTGDNRYYYIAQHDVVPRLGGSYDMGIFTDSIENEDTGYQNSDYVLLNRTSGYRFIFRGMELTKFNKASNRIQNDPNVGEIYNNGYNTIYAVTTKP